MARCMCPQPSPVLDVHVGESLCGRCGTVMESGLVEARDAGSLDAGREDYGVGTILPGEAGAPSMAARRGRRAARLGRLLATLRRMLESVGAGESVAEEAYAMCRRLAASGHAAGRDTTAVSAAILMLACRTRGRVLRWGEIPGTADRTRRIMKVYRELQYASISAPVHYTKALVSRLCTDLDLPVSVAREAISILDGMRAARFTDGKKPQCVAAAVVVLAKGDRRAPANRDVAGAAGISEPGLRNLLSVWGRAGR